VDAWKLIVELWLGNIYEFDGVFMDVLMDGRLEWPSRE
jgi:hypothetical protein